jgi:hypothetical protein
VTPARVPWPQVSLASVAAVALAAAVGGTSPVRTALVVWFFVTCPGMAIARLVDLRDGFGEAAVGIGLSLSIGLTVALALVYVGAFSGAVVFVVLAVLAVGASLAALARERGTRR